jgi:hypothetical protein
MNSVKIPDEKALHDAIKAEEKVLSYSSNNNYNNNNNNNYY